MVIAIFGRSINEDFLPYLKGLIDQLRASGGIVIGEEGFMRFLEENYGYSGVFAAAFNRSNLMEQNPELLLSIGGDGTFLDAAVYVKDSGIPILGVNTGRLGFLANVSVSEISQAVEAICAGNYSVEKRETLSLEVDGKILPGFDFALNEVSVLKTETSSLLKIHAYIGDVYLTTYWADGLIVATPTGSTAYSLSGGGPIVSPDCNNIILTPVCPHNLSMRPLLVPGDAVIRLVVEGRAGEFVLSMDSRVKRMEDNRELKVCSGNSAIHVVKLEPHNYYETLRNKLMWGEDKRNRNNRG
ncbi:MAG: NAD kinase [Odoribacter splanchnicus]|nr:NAD kinase [Odoribacter splanchnicus]